MKISTDQKALALKEVSTGASKAEVAKKFGVSGQTITNWMGKKTRGVSRTRNAGARKYNNSPEFDFVTLVANHPTLSTAKKEAILKILYTA